MTTSNMNFIDRVTVALETGQYMPWNDSWRPCDNGISDELIFSENYDESFGLNIERWMVSIERQIMFGYVEKIKVSRGQGRSVTLEIQPTKQQFKRLKKAYFGAIDRQTRLYDEAIKEASK